MITIGIVDSETKTREFTVELPLCNDCIVLEELGKTGDNGMGTLPMIRINLTKEWDRMAKEIEPMLKQLGAVTLPSFSRFKIEVVGKESHGPAN